MSGAVLIGCEFSGIVRDEFRKLGFDAWSCDLKPTDADPRWHIQGDIRDAIKSRNWHLVVLHIECTAMAVCGNRTYAGTIARREAIEWSCDTISLALSEAPHVAAENPASVIFPELRRRFAADVQYLQPWQHGHPEQKKTGLALWDLPRLVPTDDVYAEMMLLPRKERERIFFMSPGVDRRHERSRFYPGIAAAMAAQWGEHITGPNVTIHGSDLDTDPEFVTSARAAA